MKYLSGTQTELEAIKTQIEGKLGYPTAHLKSYSEVVELPNGEKALMLPNALNALGVPVQVEKLLTQDLRSRVLLSSQIPFARKFGRS